MNYVAIVDEAIGDIYTVKDLCYYANNNKFWVGVYAGRDPTMLGQATFKSNSTDVRVTVRYRRGKFYEETNFSNDYSIVLCDYSIVLCLEDPDFFKKFRQLFVDNLIKQDEQLPNFFTRTKK